MGIIPVWGFQLLLAIGLSIILRLNKALVITAANISIPPMIPIVLFLSHLVGRFWMGDDAQYLTFSEGINLQSVKHNFVQYVLGAISLAVIAGVIFAGVTYALLKIFKRSKT